MALVVSDPGGVAVAGSGIRAVVQHAVGCAGQPASGVRGLWPRGLGHWHVRGGAAVSILQGQGLINQGWIRVHLGGCAPPCWCLVCDYFLAGSAGLAGAAGAAGVAGLAAGAAGAVTAGLAAGAGALAGLNAK